MGVFEFVLLLVLISTAGKVLSRRSQRVGRPRDAPRLSRGEVESLRETVDDLSGRVMRLEEERDFYKALLDAPEGRRVFPPPETDGDG